MLLPCPASFRRRKGKKEAPVTKLRVMLCLERAKLLSAGLTARFCFALISGPPFPPLGSVFSKAEIKSGARAPGNVIVTRRHLTRLGARSKKQGVLGKCFYVAMSNSKRHFPEDSNFLDHSLLVGKPWVGLGAFCLERGWGTVALGGEARV